MNKLWAMGWLGVVLAACVGLGGCARHQAPTAAKGPPEVFVSQPVSRAITDYEEFAGHLEADQSVQVRARVTGYLLPAPTDPKTGKEVPYFQEGGKVKKGQVLFKIDPQLYEAELARAKANLEQARAHRDRLHQDALRAQKMLANQNTISREEFDKITGDYNEARAAVGVAEAALKIAQVNMDYTTVRAPFSGTISQAMIDPGNLVKADDTVLTGIGASDPIKAYFDVDERTVLRVQRLIHEGVLDSDINGVPVWMGLADEDDRPFKGEIDFLDNNVNYGTGTLRVRGLFDNPYDLLVPGMFVRVRLPIGKPQPAILIAEQALVTDQGQKFVYVVTDEQKIEHDGEVEYQGQVKYRQVKLGRLHQGLRVIKEGLSANEKVVVSGLQRVRPDIKVTFKDKDMKDLVTANTDAPAAKAKPPAAGNPAPPRAKHPKSKR